MTSYAYRAVHPSGRIQKGHMAAANENELAFYLRQLDLELIEAKTRKAAPSPLLQERVDPRERLAFCSQMEDLLRAGLPFIEALNMVVGAMQTGAFQTRLTAVAQSVRSGQAATSAFAQHSHLFDPVFLAILEAGEKSGDLAAAFERLTRQLKWQDRIKKELSRALRYPLFLFFVAFGVTSFMMGFVVPEIVSFLTSLGTELPFLTKLLIAGADLFAAVWWTLPLFLLVGWSGIALGRKISDRFAQRADGWLLALPGIGNVLKKLSLARFATSFTLLLKSGLSMPDSLRIGARTLGNKYLAARAEEAAGFIAVGRPLSQATAALFPPRILQTIRVGEKSGNMAKALDEVARLYETEAQESVSSFLGALEPALTVFVGGLLVWIVLAVLGPVYGSLGPLSGGL